jgi:hypothetical protein
MHTAINKLSQVLPLLYHGRMSDDSFHISPSVVDFPAASASQHRHGGRVYHICHVAGRPSCHFHPALGTQELDQLPLQHLRFWPRSQAQRRVRRHPLMATAEVGVPELASGVCLWTYWTDIFVLDHGDGLFSFCGWRMMLCSNTPVILSSLFCFFGIPGWLSVDVVMFWNMIWNFWEFWDRVRWVLASVGIGGFERTAWSSQQHGVEMWKYLYHL